MLMCLQDMLFFFFETGEMDKQPVTHCTKRTRLHSFQSTEELALQENEPRFFCACVLVSKLPR